MTAGLAEQAPAQTDLGERTVSRSRQFIVYAPERNWRSAVATVAEDTKDWLLGRLRLRDEWSVPIVVQIRQTSTARPGERRVSLQVFQTEIGPKIQLDLRAGTAEVPGSFQEEVVRAVLLDLGLREAAHTPAGSTYAMPPEWLVSGFFALRAQEDGGRRATLYEGLLQKGQLPALEEFLVRRTDGMDSTSRGIHVAYSAALVQAILDLPEGRAGLLRFLRSRVGNATDERIAFREAFPQAAGDPAEFEKWWALALARLSAGDRHFAMGAEETARRLDQILTLAIRDASGQEQLFALRDHARFAKLPGAGRALSVMAAEITPFASVANPLFLPVIDAYAQIAARIATGRTRGLDAQLAEVEALREHVTRLAAEITDHLNWVEATQIGTTSGAFEAYLRAARQGPPPPSRRDDAISKYLDSMEMELR